DPSDAEAIRLTDRQREELASLATILHVKRRATIYLEDAVADSVFSMRDGVVKAYRELASGKRVVHAFLFPRDLFGLADGGRYVNSARAVTDATIYRLPMAELSILLRHDGDLQYGFLAKVTHELREAQRRSILMNRRDAAGRLAMFLVFVGERVDAPASRLPLPMTRSDMAAFLGLTLEAVSRAARVLERRGLVKFDGLHSVRILDPARLATLAAAV